MKDFGLQLFSIRASFADKEGVRAAFKWMKEVGYSYGQTAGTYDFISAEEYGQIAKEEGITICGTHYNWDRIKNDVPGTIAYHKALGTTNIGIGGMPGDARENEDALKVFIKEFNDMAAIYAKEGFKLTYHNHSFEFKKLSDGKTMFDHLIEKLDPNTTSFVLDTYWCQHGGIDVRAMIERLAGRIEILHLKDMESCHNYSFRTVVVNADGVPEIKMQSMAAPCIIEVGAGNINFKDIIPLAEKCGVKYFVVEDDRCPAGTFFEVNKRSADYIKANLLEK